MAQEPTVLEKLDLPLVLPPSNHGNTFAAWFLALSVFVSFTIAAVGFCVQLHVVTVIGAVLTALSLIVSAILAKTGRGQKGYVKVADLDF